MNRQFNLCYRCMMILALALLLNLRVHAAVQSIHITSKETVLNGKTFGNSGAYELWKGTVTFVFDPLNKQNQRVTDIDLAEKSDAGFVEATANIVILKPADMSKASGVGLVEVSNRGGKFSMRYFNLATNTGLDVNDPEAFGDGLLMEQGLVVVWVGWEFDVPDQDGLMHLVVPKLKPNNSFPLVGQVRCDWVIDDPVSTLYLGHRNQIPYPPQVNSTLNSLTVRDSREGKREIVDSKLWSFSKEEGDSLVPSTEYIHMNNGFEPGKIYELVYFSDQPVAVGLGLAVVRDMISYMKYDNNCEFKVNKGIAAGVSQTGRFLRQYLYDGFNIDEYDRQAYDGMMIMTAGGGRGSFNHRFAQPSRDGHRYSSFFYPTDLFPFTSRAQVDSTNGKYRDGLLMKGGNFGRETKIFYINTGYEYYGRAASLIHTSIDGTSDVMPYENERIYEIASGQHYVGQLHLDAKSQRDSSMVFKSNPLYYLPNYRALLVRLINWVNKGEEPPASTYPTIAGKTLVPLNQVRFPINASLPEPKAIQVAYNLDFGDSWQRRIIRNQPPRILNTYTSLVPQLDQNGNELGGIRNFEVSVPLATFTGWSLRDGKPAAQDELDDFQGYIMPFSMDKGAEISTDLRPTIKSLYHDRMDYEQQVTVCVDQLIKDGFVLDRDKTLLQKRAGWLWNEVIGYYVNQQAAHHPVMTPEHGSLMVIGGGKLDETIYSKFADLAGGTDQPIVIIPTAGDDESLAKDPKYEQLTAPFRSAGFKKISVLHTRSKEEANSPRFYRDLEKAAGVFITGGRQWRLADSYLGTQTETALKGVLDRGGVIAGTSAGATIQGSYLVRGDTGGNTEMMGDHQEGFGFLNNVAIDQHVLARNRQFDLFEVINAHPGLLGIAPDEGTAFVINQGIAEVIGKSYVLVYDGKKWSGDRREYSYNLPGSPIFYVLKPGDRYDLSQRMVQQQ
ncbi:MAG: cyanophycinase [Saprospiraceae bacterium]|nr:cyanophycinase [Saprospiraceae bacterium]MCB9319047.1 cyanophycinase [Lewinellaceae bacterium]